MAFTVGENSFVSLADAEAYFETRLDVAAWTEAAESQKLQALATATGTLNEMRWSGIAVSESQSLAFPRLGTYFDPRVGAHVSLDGATARKRVDTATFELAYHLLNNDGLMDDTGSVTDLQVANIVLTKVVSADAVPAVAQRAIKPLLLNGGSNVWWRAN